MQLKTQISEYKSAIEKLENHNKIMNVKYNESLKQNEILEAQKEACNKRLSHFEKNAYLDERQSLKSYA